MADDLRLNKIGRGEFLCYAGLFIVGGLFMILSSLSPSDSPDDFFSITYSPEFLRYIESLLYFIATLGIIVLAYTINKSGDNQKFWYRYLSISFPIGIIMSVIFIITLFIFAILGVIDPEVFAYTDLLLEAIFYVLVAYFTKKYMRYISDTNPSISPQTAPSLQSPS